MGGGVGQEVLLAGAGCLQVFGADFEDVFEVDADVGEFSLQEHDDVFVVLAFLLAGGGFGGMRFGEGL